MKTFTFSVPVDQLQEAFFLKALAQIETGVNDNAKGKDGERTRYQIMPFMWNQVCTKDIRFGVVDANLASKVALIILTELSKEFHYYVKRKPDWHELYVLWNKGPVYFKRFNWDFSKLPPQIKDRGIRYSNLVTVEQSKN